MRFAFRPVIAVSLPIAAHPAAAHEFVLKDLHVGHPYARATPPGVRAGGACFTVENGGAQDDRLIAVSSPRLPLRRKCT